MITAEDIAKVTFSKPPIGKRGYNEDEVDAFLDALEPEIAARDAELERFRAQPLSSGPVYGLTPPSATPSSPPTETPTAAASRLLELAETTAAQITDESRTEADRVMREAQARAARIVSEAETTAATTMASIRDEEQAIREKIDMLRLFEANYRERIDSYISNQLAALRAEPRVE